MTDQEKHSAKLAIKWRLSEIRRELLFEKYPANGTSANEKLFSDALAEYDGAIEAMWWRADNED